MQVIFFTDPVDEYLMQYLTDYEDKKFQDVYKEGLKIRKDNKDKKIKDSFKVLTTWWKCVLGNRLADSPCEVVAPKFGWSAYLDRSMQSRTLSDTRKQAYMKGKKMLEINPRHPIIKELREKVVKDSEDESIKRIARLMYKTALMESGFILDDPKEFASRIYDLVKSSLSISSDVTVEDEEEEAICNDRVLGIS